MCSLGGSASALVVLLAPLSGDQALSQLTRDDLELEDGKLISKASTLLCSDASEPDSSAAEEDAVRLSPMRLAILRREYSGKSHDVGIILSRLALNCSKFRAVSIHFGSVSVFICFTVILL